ESVGATVADFPLARLDQPALDALLARFDRRDIEDLYPLAPLQKGILFHALYEAGEAPYITQTQYELEGELDLAAFRQACQAVVARHAILRTGFVWDGLDEPLQKVHRAVEVPVVWEDWRELPSEERRARLEDHLRAEREHGFDLEQPPLIRLWLAQIAEQSHLCVWSSHHLLLDGWCLAVVLGETMSFYEASRQGREIRLRPPRPFRDYIAWLAQQELSQAEIYWRKTLAGFRAPTLLPLDRPFSSHARAGGWRELPQPVGVDSSERLTALARRHRLTLNTLFQGAWAVVLSRYGGGQDIVFGSIVSGRPPELPGVESILGLFINTLPFRTDVSP